MLILLLSQYTKCHPEFVLLHRSILIEAESLPTAHKENHKTIELHNRYISICFLSSVSYLSEGAFKQLLPSSYLLSTMLFFIFTNKNLCERIITYKILIRRQKNYSIPLREYLITQHIGINLCKREKGVLFIYYQFKVRLFSPNHTLFIDSCEIQEGTRSEYIVTPTRLAK